MRLIFHLSHPRGKGLSINENTLKHKCTVRYPDFNEAVQLCIHAGKSCTIAKSDFSTAFRNVPLSQKMWAWLVMMAVLPFDRQEYFFVDKCRPFGAAISCLHFQKISDAIAHVV